MENTAVIDGNGNIVIQDLNGSTVVINPDNTEELRKLVMNLGGQLSTLPTEILKLIEEKQKIVEEVVKGANIYLTVVHQLVNYDLRGASLKFSLTITNLTKENRYFYSPTFKVTPKFDLPTGGEHDTFMMTPEQTKFPKKLEYGEPVNVTFDINPRAYGLYQSLLSKDADAFLQCFISTTVGEVYESNQFKISILVGYINGLTK